MIKGCIHINFDGKLIGKGRPRFGKGRVYTPAKTLAAETSLGYLAKIIMKKCAIQQMKGPVSLFCNVMVAYPKTWSKKRRAESHPFYTGKPDADNVLKLVGDSLNGIVWRDDSQVAKISFQRTWWESDHVYIRIEEIE